MAPWSSNTIQLQSRSNTNNHVTLEPSTEPINTTLKQMEYKNKIKNHLSHLNLLKSCYCNLYSLFGPEQYKPPPSLFNWEPKSHKWLNLAFKHTRRAQEQSLNYEENEHYSSYSMYNLILLHQNKFFCSQWPNYI